MEVILIRNKFECGSGTCSQVAFLKDKGSLYKQVGWIEGKIDKVDWPSDQFPVVTTAMKLDSETRETAVWKYNSQSQVYETH